jgi:hypothetical protein
VNNKSFTIRKVIKKLLHYQLILVLVTNQLSLLNPAKIFASEKPTENLASILKRINNSTLLGLPTDDFASFVIDLKKFKDLVPIEERVKFGLLMSTLEQYQVAIKQFDDCGKTGSLKEITHQSAFSSLSELSSCENQSTELQLEKIINLSDQMLAATKHLEINNISEQKLREIADQIYAHQRETLLGPTLVLTKRYFDPNLKSLEDFFNSNSLFDPGRIYFRPDIDGKWAKTYQDLLTEIPHEKQGVENLAELMANRLKKHHQLGTDSFILQQNLRLTKKNHEDLLMLKNHSKEDMKEALETASFQPLSLNQFPQLKKIGFQNKTLLTDPKLKISVGPVNYEQKWALENRNNIFKRLILRTFLRHPKELHRRLAIPDSKINVLDSSGKIVFIFKIQDLFKEMERVADRSIIVEKFQDAFISSDQDEGGGRSVVLEAARVYDEKSIPIMLNILRGDIDITIAQLTKIHSQSYNEAYDQYLFDARIDLSKKYVEVRTEQDLAEEAIKEGDVGRAVLGSINENNRLGLLALSPNEILSNHKKIEEGLKSHVESTFDLLSEFEQDYQKTPKEFIKSAIGKNPMLVAGILQKNPELAGYICSLSKDVIIDEEQSMRWRKAALIAMTAAAVILTATAIGAPAGSVLAAFAAGGGLALGATGAIAGFREHSKLGHQSEVLIDHFRALGEQSGLSASQAMFQAKELMGEARSALRWAVVDTVLVPFDVVGVTQALLKFKNVDELKNIMRDPLKMRKFVVSQTSADQKSIAFRLSENKLTNPVRGSEIVRGPPLTGKVLPSAVAKTPLEIKEINSARKLVSSPMESTGPYQSQIVVGDIHGDPLVFHRALRRWGVMDVNGHWVGGKQKVIVLGDIPDRGPNSLDALDEIIRLKNEAQSAGGDVVVIAGNHDAMMLGAAADPDPNSISFSNWIKNGGDKVLVEVAARMLEKGKSFKLNGKKVKSKKELDGVTGSDLIESSPEVFIEFRKTIGPRSHYWNFYAENSALVFQYGNVGYVHGSYNSSTIAKGNDVINREWQDVLRQASEGNVEPLHNLAGQAGSARGGANDAAIFWQDANTAVDQNGSLKTAQTLRERDGITLVMGGHSKHAAEMVDEQSRLRRPGVFTFGESNKMMSVPHIMTDTGASVGYKGTGDASVFVDGSSGHIYWYNPKDDKVEVLSHVTPTLFQ